MGSASIELKVRVIVVTTRAALRHAGTDPEQRRLVVGRGLELLEALETESPDADGTIIGQGRADLEAMVSK